jgi:hypothetical protein
MTRFIKNGNQFMVASEESMDVRDMLPAGNYTVKEMPMGGPLYLEQIDSFKPLTKVYGDSLKNTQRIINTFLDRPNATGVMLTGEKGSGKTLLTKNVSIELAKKDIPTIVINAPWHGDKFNSFIQTITQPCAILFDEFEKVYDRDEQEAILTLLDGVFPSKKLFMLTTNDKYRVDYHMRNRPGRIFYMLDFKGLDGNFITEYCQDNLKNTTHIDKIVNISTLFAEFNFDMLKALCEEMNRYDETPQEALRMLNAKPEFDGGSKYNVEVVHNGEVVKGDINPSVFNGNPLQPKGIEVSFDADPDDDNVDWEYMEFNSNALVSVDAQAGKFVFEDKGTRLILTKVQSKSYNYLDAF